MKYNRYVQWSMFRVSAFMTRSWRSYALLFAVFLGLFVSQLGVQMLSSPSAVSAVLQHLRPTNSPAPSDGVSPLTPVWGSDIAAPPIELKDPLAAPPIEDIRQALEDYQSMPGWLVSLENTQMSERGVKVMVSDPEKLTDRQRRLMQIQGMVISPWTPPGTNDRLTAVPEYWIQWNSDPASWIIHARSLDVSPNAQGPGSLVVLRAILWIDALAELEKWEMANPAPQPPPEIYPGGVSTSLVPSLASNLMMATSVTWIIALVLMSIWAVVQMSAWGTLRASGGLLPFAGLTHQTAKLLLSQATLLFISVFALVAFAGILALTALLFFGHSVSLHWIWRVSLVIGLGVAFSHAISTLLQCWPMSREPRQVLGSLWVIVLAALNVWVAGSWQSMRPLAAVLSSHGVFYATVVAVVVVFFATRLSAWRLDANARVGYLSN